MREKLLKGRRVLVVEDDYFLADDIRIEFERAGAEVLGPVGRVKDALHLLEGCERLDGAILDINLGGEKVYDVADALQARAIPFVFATGYDAEIIPERYTRVLRCEKPIEPVKIGEALFSRELG
jgi:CheY-like chemotaxis protein